MQQRKDQMRRERIAKFSLEMLKVRSLEICGREPEYQMTTGHRVDEAEFLRWLAVTPPVVGVGFTASFKHPLAKARHLTAEESRLHVSSAMGIQRGMATLVQERGLGDVGFVIDGGAVELTSEEFYEWCRDFNLGSIGWVGGDFLPGKEDDRATRWRFLIARNAAHLDSSIRGWRPNIVARLLLRIGGPLTRWLSFRARRFDKS